jgi:hypothetical protein
MYNNLSTDESIDFLISYFEERNIKTFLVIFVVIFIINIFHMIPIKNAL